MSLSKNNIAFSLLLLFLWHSARSQFLWAEIGVNGLTCSQCSRSTEMSIKRLAFVQDVQMDLEHTNGKITFKPGFSVNIEKIAKAVEDAGFSVRYLTAEFDLTGLKIDPSACFTFEKRTYQFIETDPAKISGKIHLQFLGKKFLSTKDYKIWQTKLLPQCVDKKDKPYFVRLS